MVPQDIYAYSSLAINYSLSCKGNWETVFLWVAIYKLKIKILKLFYLRPIGRKFQGLLKGKARRGTRDLAR